MRKVIVGMLTCTLLIVTWGLATVTKARVPEACLAVNPGVPTCTFTVQQQATFNELTGVSAVGDWVVTVKRGKKKFRFKSTGSIPDGPEFFFKPGDVVKAYANSPGTYVLVGHD